MSTKSFNDTVNAEPPACIVSTTPPLLSPGYINEWPASTLIANSVLSSSLNVNVMWLVESKFVILIYLTSTSSN